MLARGLLESRQHARIGHPVPAEREHQLHHLFRAGRGHPLAARGGVALSAPFHASSSVLPADFSRSAAVSCGRSGVTVTKPSSSSLASLPRSAEWFAIMWRRNWKLRPFGAV